jgi:hypothetical protein
VANNGDRDINALLAQVFERLTQDEKPLTFDFEKVLLELGCGPSEAELLADYIPSACGRAFLREIDVIPTDTYARPNKDGSPGPPQRFSDDPIWTIVEMFVEKPRRSANVFPALTALLTAPTSALCCAARLNCLLDADLVRKVGIASLWHRCKATVIEKARRS